MARGLLAGLFFGVLLAGLILAVAALQLNSARHIDVVEVPPEVLAEAGQPPVSAPDAPQSPSVPGGDAIALRPVGGLPSADGSVDAPLAPGTVPVQPEAAETDLTVLTAPDALSPEVDPFGPEGAQTPLAVVSEALGLSEQPWPQDGPILDRVLPPLLPEGTAFDAVPPLGDVAASGDAPEVALAELGGVGVPEIDVAIPEVAESGRPEIGTDVALLGVETGPGDLPVFGPVPRIGDLITQKVSGSAVARADEIDGPVMALVLRSSGGPVGDVPEAVMSQIVPLGTQGEAGVAGEQVVLIPADVKRGALSLLAWEMGQQGKAAPLWLRQSPEGAQALNDVLGLATVSGAGVIVEAEALALRAMLSTQGVPHAPAFTTLDLSRAASHARRDGAVIVVLESEAAGRAALAQWAQSADAAPVRLVPVSEALARLTR